MIYSKYLPVNIKRENAAIHTMETTYPVKLLTLAHAALCGEGSGDGKVVVENGVITFTESPNISWSIKDVYLAWEAYSVALENNFSFYTIKSIEGIPQLFVSKLFRGHRLLVNAMTFQTVVVTRPNIVRKISTMIDKRFETIYCLNLFHTISGLETGRGKFLDALIVGRDTEEEYMAVNPATNDYVENTLWYARDLVNEFVEIVNNPNQETESMCMSEKGYIRRDLQPGTWVPMSYDHLQTVVNLYNKLLDKKNNYIAIYDSAEELPYFYISTNWRYLVKASTFEVIQIKSDFLKKLIQSYVVKGSIAPSELEMAWLIATEGNSL